MARFKNGINGPFSGKIGMIVGASCRGVAYARSLPRKSDKPATPAQDKQRAKFKLIMGWLQPLLELINIGYQALVGEKTAMNNAVSYHMKNAIYDNGEEFGVDFKKAIFSRGELLISLVLEVLCLVGKVISVKWKDNVEHAFSMGADKASFIIYNPVKEEYVTFQDVALRADGEVDLQLPDHFGNDSVHAWMQYVNQEGDMVSTSSYLGKIEVM